VLVAERSLRVGVTTAAHQLGNARTAGRCPREPGVPQIVFRPISA
jgi:hypothetical protein